MFLKAERVFLEVVDHVRMHVSLPLSERGIFSNSTPMNDFRISYTGKQKEIC